MERFRIIRGIDARESGMYKSSQLILERAEEEYDSGLWLLPEDGYAEFYDSFEALMDKARDIFQ